MIAKSFEIVYTFIVMCKYSTWLPELEFPIVNIEGEYTT